jgi:hypothetical protein
VESFPVEKDADGIPEVIVIFDYENSLHSQIAS